jgi:uncharacterized repeat protein (TIGR03803 family)
MKWRSFVVTAVLSSVVGFLTSTALRAEDPSFEEIETITTSLEPCGEMVNRGDGYFYAAARWTETYRGGAIFRIAPHQPAEILHTFPYLQDGSQPNYGGANPSCGLVLGRDGAFYGANDSGGANGNGTIFRLSADGVFSVVHDFTTAEGYHVTSLLAVSTGELYGTTGWGGAHGGGTIFRVGTDGVFQTVFEFNDNPKPPSGEQVPPYSPFALMEGSDGQIYGTTIQGGPPNPSQYPFYFGYGTFYRYDGPNAISVLSDFDTLKDHVTSMASAAGGFYVGMDRYLVHMAFDGTRTVKADFSPEQNGPPVRLGSIAERPDGVYGVAFYGGANQTGFLYRVVPGEGYSVLHDFPVEYLNQQRRVVVGNDGLIYGLAAFPQGYTLPTSSGLTGSSSAIFFQVTGSAKTQKVQKGSKTTTARPRTFRIRKTVSQSPNFVPVAKVDTAWLPALALSSERAVTVDVLLNDRDPDNNPVTLTSVLPPENATAEVISIAGRKQLRFATREADPAGRAVSYQISDGNGGTAVGTVFIHSLVTGTYTGTATDTSTPPAPSAVLTVTMGKQNTVSVSFVQGTQRYAGRGVLEADETANIPLTLKGRPPMNLHLSLQRGTPRQFSATIQGGGSIYTAVCPQKPL